ncbi:hypothetical protein M0813_13874 [Anaeramoeba flamelloides]|uniref:Uncharacterized protein n=1 Tax=Anaeramoeba flamelloides TaxID=1746091 RepID=A0ABQ8Z7E7_9EUKA|nr:hypothetical protein M0813_13874 [Anaeramoeba flamelloides]
MDLDERTDDLVVSWVIKPVLSSMKRANCYCAISGLTTEMTTLTVQTRCGAILNLLHSAKQTVSILYCGAILKPQNPSSMVMILFGAADRLEHKVCSSKKRLRAPDPRLKKFSYDLTPNLIAFFRINNPLRTEKDYLEIVLSEYRFGFLVDRSCTWQASTNAQQKMNAAELNCCTNHITTNSHQTLRQADLLHRNREISKTCYRSHDQIKIIHVEAGKNPMGINRFHKLNRMMFRQNEHYARSLTRLLTPKVHFDPRTLDFHNR